MFQYAFSKETFDKIMTMFFQNLGMLNPGVELLVRELEFDGDAVIVTADVDPDSLETIN